MLKWKRVCHTLEAFYFCQIGIFFFAAYNLVYNKENNTWNAVSGEQSFELVKMNEDGTATLSLQNGTSMTVIPDAQGIATARIAIGNSLFFAAR